VIATILIVGAVDHAHVVMERFEHPRGLVESLLEQLQESNRAP
jgi:hypothetical protein